MAKPTVAEILLKNKPRSAESHSLLSKANTKKVYSYSDFLNAEERLKQERSKKRFQLRRQRYWDSLTQEEKRTAWTRWNKKLREKPEYLEKESKRKKIYYQKNRERLAEKARIRYQESVKK